MAELSAPIGVPTTLGAPMKNIGERLEASEKVKHQISDFKVDFGVLL